MVLALALGVLGLSWWIFMRVEHSKKLIAACSHDYYYVSAWNEGNYWNRKCRYCPFQEPVTDQELIDRLQREFRCL